MAEKAEKYNYLIYVILFCFSLILLIYDNYSSLWSWLLIFLGFSFLTIVNDFILRGKLILNSIIAIIQYSLILLLVYISNGFGSVPLVYVLQLGIFTAYKTWISVVINIFLLITFSFYLYIFPQNNPKTIYPAVFLLLSGLVGTLMMLSLNNIKQLQQENFEQITRLHVNRKQLQDINKQMKQYSEDMEKVAILRERNRMSKQIHDTLGHVLTAASVQLEAAELLIEKNTPEALKKISNAKEQTREGLRSIKQALALIDQDNMQFEDRIFDIIKNSQRSMNIKILPQIKIDRNLPSGVQELILSALKEGITNGVRHGQASAFVFRLIIDCSQILFYLMDNGSGTDKICTGYGLTAMEKQTVEQGGIIETFSVKNEGFTIKITIPYKGENNVKNTSS